MDLLLLPQISYRKILRMQKCYIILAYFKKFAEFGAFPKYCEKQIFAIKFAEFGALIKNIYAHILDIL